jgi:anaerobic selenocysteine-containing dehydrogenase
MSESSLSKRVPSYCALCRSRCGCFAVVEAGRLVAVEPNPAHPTGSALCAKGRAAPDLVYSPDRLLYPLKRTKPKGAADPGWQRIGWDEALALAAAEMNRIRSRHGAEAVAFSVTSPSGSAVSDGIGWIQRLINAFGSPNWCYATEICNWHKDHARAFTFGVGVTAPDFARAGCILLWGHNPSTAWLTHASETAQAKARGARLVVVDPRHAGPAAKADLWLRVRPGSDGALALGVAGVMIEQGWYDRDFMRDWSNGPLLVHPETGRFLSEADLAPDGDARRLMAWDEVQDAPLLYDTVSGTYGRNGARPALLGRFPVETTRGRVAAPTAFELYRDLCRRYPPERVAELCWIPAAQVRAMAQLLYESRPVAYYGWTGIGQHTNATQTDRAVALVCALTGSFDAPGGNVIFEKVRVNDVTGGELMGAGQRAKTIGLAARPIGPARAGWVTARDLYDAIIEGKPYPVRGLVGFGANLVVSHADGARAREALRRLEFFVHADLFMNPTAELADLVLPVASAWERDGLRCGFEVSQAAEQLVQYRPAAVEPRGEARSDSRIVFELAKRLGLGNQFWDGDIEAGYRHLLAPSGLALEDLRAAPEGIRVPLETRHRKYRDEGDGMPRGFATPTRKVEVYSEHFLEHGQSPLPDFVEPPLGPYATPELATRFPLVLTSAKTPQYCHGQHRNLPKLRRLLPDPIVELHPDAARVRDIADGAWVVVETPYGAFRARARLRDSLDVRVVCGQHGWWQACRELGLPGYAATGAESANYNAAVRADSVDPISGSVPHRAQLCELRKA